LLFLLPLIKKQIFHWNKYSIQCRWGRFLLLGMLLVDSFFFRDKDGLYKVRFGSYENYQIAKNQGEKFKANRYFKSFFVVKPQVISKHAGSSVPTNNGKPAITYSSLRKRIVASTKRFIGTPYRWGGSSLGKGVDCSGLTSSAYLLNGLRLPRTSQGQFRKGKYVAKSKLSPGDLVFFQTIPGSKSISHVGVYIGQGVFVHAPGRGKRVRKARLSNSYFRKHYAGGRSYL